MTIETAVQIAAGREKITDDASPVRIRGAENDYNAKGRGSTMARRVLRDGAWHWVSSPASRGRYLAGDRHDTKYGDVWVGEIVAEYTLGGRGSPAPHRFFLVIDVDPKHCLKELAHTKRRDGQFSLTLPNIADPLVVADPNWR